MANSWILQNNYRRFSLKLFLGLLWRIRFASFKARYGRYGYRSWPIHLVQNGGNNILSPSCWCYIPFYSFIFASFELFKKKKNSKHKYIWKRYEFCIPNKRLQIIRFCIRHLAWWLEVMIFWKSGRWRRFWTIPKMLFTYHFNYKNN